MWMGGYISKKIYMQNLKSKGVSLKIFSMERNFYFLIYNVFLWFNNAPRPPARPLLSIFDNPLNEPNGLFNLIKKSIIID